MMVATNSPIMRDNVPIVCKEITFKSTKAMTTKLIMMLVRMVISPSHMYTCLFVYKLKCIHVHILILKKYSDFSLLH